MVAAAAVTRRLGVACIRLSLHAATRPAAGALLAVQLRGMASRPLHDTFVTPDERLDAIQALGPSWREVPEKDALEKTFHFKDFSGAWGWMSRAALVAEKMDHHPTWTNTYGEVTVLLTTHEQDGVTWRDVRLAREMDRIERECGVATIR